MASIVMVGLCIVEDTTAVVMDAYRLRDEWARISSAVPRRAPTRAWRPTGGPLDAVMRTDPTLTALNQGLLERVRAPREPSQAPAPWIASAPPRAPVRAAGPSPAQSTDDADFFELIDRGRAQMRASDDDAAERSPRGALELRPGDRVAMQNLRALAQRRGDTVSTKK